MKSWLLHSTLSLMFCAMGVSTLMAQTVEWDEPPFGSFADSKTGEKSQTSSPVTNSTLIVKAPPETIIWVGSLRYGVIPENGEVAVKNLSAGSYTIRARLKGKRELRRMISLKAGAESSINLDFREPATKAELAFQNAVELREKGAHADAIKGYRSAIKLAPR